MGGRFAWIGAVVAVVGIAVSCVGCGGDGKPADPSTRPPASTSQATTSTSPTGSVTPSAPTVPADVPTTGPNLLKPGEKPPVMPIEATRHTAEGAAAFAKFFVQTIDWGYASTSSTYMRHYSSASCRSCMSFIASLDKAAAAGQRYLGGRFTLRSAQSASESDGIVTVRVIFDVTSYEKVDAQGTFVSADIAHRGEQFEVGARWASNGWVADALRVLA